MIEIEKKDGEYLVIDAETRRVIRRTKHMGVANETRRQLISHADYREYVLRRNEARRAELTAG